MALNMDRIKQKQQAMKREGSSYWRPEDGGKNQIRVFKFGHKVTKEEAEAGLFSAKEVGKITEDIDRVVTRQYGLHPENIPMVSTERSLDLYAEIKKKDAELAKQIRPSKAYFLNIVDTLDPQKKVVLYGAPKTVFNDIIKYITDPEYGEEVLGCNGDDFIIEYNSKAPPTEMYSTRLRKSGTSEKLPSGLEKQVVDLYSSEAEAVFGEVCPDKLVDDWQDGATPSNGNGKEHSKPVATEDPFDVPATQPTRAGRRR